MRVHHVGVVAVDAGPTLALLDVIGRATMVGERQIEEWQCHRSMYQLDGGGALFEIVRPYGGRLRDWFDERGVSLHHVAVQVPSLDAACHALRAAGVRLVSEHPVVGVGGILVNFVPPSHCGVMVELVEVR